jgi:hypothetical protein
LLSHPGDGPVVTDLGAIVGRPLWLDDRWQILIGQTMFQYCSSGDAGIGAPCPAGAGSDGGSPRDGGADAGDTSLDTGDAPGNVNEGGLERDSGASVPRRWPTLPRRWPTSSVRPTRESPTPPPAPSMRATLPLPTPDRVMPPQPMKARAHNRPTRLDAVLDVCSRGRVANTDPWLFSRWRSPLWSGAAAAVGLLTRQ